jgi:hypothetical protein
VIAQSPAYHDHQPYRLFAELPSHHRPLHSRADWPPLPIADYQGIGSINSLLFFAFILKAPQGRMHLLGASSRRVRRKWGSVASYSSGLGIVSGRPLGNAAPFAR